MSGATDTELRELERAYGSSPDDQDSLLALANGYLRAGRQEDCRDLKSTHIDYLAWHRGALAIKEFLLDELAQLPQIPLAYYGGKRMLENLQPTQHPGLMIWQANNFPTYRRFVFLVPCISGVTESGLYVFNYSDCNRAGSTGISEAYPYWPGTEEAGLYIEYGQTALRKIYDEKWRQEHTFS